MTAEPARRSIFDHVPEEEWEEDVDDDPGDVAPPAAVDMEVLHPIKQHEG